MKVNDLIALLKEHGIETTPAEVKARLGSVSAIQEKDIPSVVEVWKEFMASGLTKPASAIAKTKVSNSLSGKSVPSSVSSVPSSVSRINSDQYQEAIAAQFAQPLIDANSSLDRLQQGVSAAAAHLHNRKQQILDDFYEIVAAPVQGQELSHFFSQIPDDLKPFFE